jgi:hypothetical protein
MEGVRRSKLPNWDLWNQDIMEPRIEKLFSRPASYSSILVKITIKVAGKIPEYRIVLQGDHGVGKNVIRAKVPKPHTFLIFSNHLTAMLVCRAHGVECIPIQH